MNTVFANISKADSFLLIMSHEKSTRSAVDSNIPSENMMFSCRKIFPVKNYVFAVEKYLTRKILGLGLRLGLGLGRGGLGLEWSGLGLG